MCFNPTALDTFSVQSVEHITVRGSSGSYLKYLTLFCFSELRGILYSALASNRSIFSKRSIHEIDNILSKGETSVHVTSLDALVYVNSLFAIVVFVVFSLENHG